MSSKATSRNKIKVAVAMATREMVIAPPIFNRETKNFAQISTIVYTPTVWICVSSNKKL